MDLSNVPSEYRDLKGVFSKSRAASLPPHRPYDCAIDLLPGTSPPKGKLYSLSAPEREAMEKYISDSLAAKIIRPSSTFTFTFLHLADAFIQSDLQLHSGYTFLLVHVFPGNRTHNLSLS